MNKRKIISCVLLGVMCLSCLAGCGKTEEEKAIEELQENVAQDDKSLDDYLNDVDEFVANREEMDDLGASGSMGICGSMSWRMQHRR